METEKLKELIQFETGIDVNKNSRKREIIETRALYFNLLKELNPILTLTEIGETVNKDHSTVIYSLRNYKVYEKYNSVLKHLKIRLNTKIQEENMLNLNDNNALRLELKKLQNKISSLELDLEEKELLLDIKSKELRSKYKYEIINELNTLLIDTKDTDKFDSILLRLEAFYSMNKNK